MFIFPYPPSINSYWGFSGSHRFLTPKAKTFKQEVLLSSIGHKKYGSNRLSVSIVLNPPDRRIRDIDNSIKSLLDAMCQAGLFEDDSQVDKLSVERGAIVKGGCCKVTISLLPVL